MKNIIDIDLYSLRDNERDIIDINNMPDKAKQYYFLLYSFYSEMLIEYLKKNTIIKKCDEELFNSSLNFKSIDNYNKDFYQSLSNLKYFYIRNNLYLLRLTKEENDFLKDRLINNNYKFDEDMNNFIYNTFRKVISENTKDQLYINYGPRESDYFAPNNALVLGIRYDELEKDNLNDNDWYERYKYQKEFLEKISKDLLENINQKLNCNCCIFEYNDYTVKKKNNKVKTI